MLYILLVSSLSNDHSGSPGKAHTVAGIRSGTTVPVIDLTHFIDGEGAPDATVKTIREACKNVGFFQVVGHGIDPALFQGVLSMMGALAGLPDDVLATLESPTGHPFRGVSTRRSDSGDVFVRRLQVNRFEDPAHAIAQGVPARYADYFHPNVWPDQIESLRETWEAFFSATRNLGRQIMSLLALALELPRDYFDAALQLDVSTMSANYYPAQEILSTPGNPKVILGEHEDSGVLTVLSQSGDYTGLQLKTVDGDWIDVPVVANSFVINIGDLLARWTNGKWTSTTHRVIAAEEPGQSRISVPTFYLPAIDTVIEPFPSCIGPEGPLYEPITPYDWEAEYFRKPNESAELGAYPDRVTL
jgi:isopenicillin N synthase-like dioxygenase